MNSISKKKLILITIFFSIAFLGIGCKKEKNNDVLRSNKGYTDSNVKSVSKNSTKDIKKKVDTNIKTILSSPKESSNPTKYIKAHEKEYNEIVQLGEPALNYILGKFSNKSEDGLESWIMAKICNDILGDKNPVKNKWDTGNEWYHKYLEKSKK